MLLSALYNRGWDVSLPPFPQPGSGLFSPGGVWWGWVPSCSAKGVGPAKCCVSAEDYHLPDASGCGGLPATPAARRADFSFSNRFASDYSHIWQKPLLNSLHLVEG